MHRLVLITLLPLAWTACTPDTPPSAREAAVEKDYQFSYDWVTSNIPVWERVLAPFVGRPDVHYLEIGVFEGRSAIWMLENVLTHPTSTLTGIDLFPGDLKDRYFANLRRSGLEHKTITIEGRSQIRLRELKPDSYDIIYIDGGHTADMVLADAVLSWELLKMGGVLIFDDYQWERETYPDELRPGPAIDAFITTYRNYLEIVHRGYQAIVRKIEGPEFHDPYSTLLGDYVYRWQVGELRTREDDRLVELPDGQKRILENLVRERLLGQMEFVLDTDTARQPAARELLEFLGIEVQTRVPAERQISLWLAVLSSLITFLLGLAVASQFKERRTRQSK